VQVLQLGPKIIVHKSKYGCRYYNKAPKFQLVKVSINVNIESLNEEFNPKCNTHMHGRFKITDIDGLDTLK